MDIANLLESDGPRQLQGSRVGTKCSTVQPVKTPLPKVFKNSVSQLRSQARPAKLLVDCNVLRPGHASPELSSKIYQDQRGLSKIDEVESGDLVAVQRNHAQLPCGDFLLQLTSQPFGDIFDVRNHAHVLNRENLKREIVRVGVLRQPGFIEIDAVKAVDLSKINRTKEIGYALLDCDLPSIIFQIALNFVGQAAQPGRRNSGAMIFYRNSRQNVGL